MSPVDPWAEKQMASLRAENESLRAQLHRSAQREERDLDLINQLAGTLAQLEQVKGMKRPTKDHRCGTRAGYQAHRRRGEDACKACKKGNSVEVTASKNRLNEPVPLQECGTRAAYLRHLAAGEEPCPECREAARSYGRSRRTGREAPTKGDRCGTESGYRAHLKRGEDGCEPCLRANAAASLVRAKAPVRVLQPCGTKAAYQRHLKHGETPCARCREAGRQYRGTAIDAKSLPIVAPEDAHKAPCTNPRNGYIWDPQRDGESLKVALDRWRLASLLCVTSCPVLGHCEASKAMAGGSGVWAGRIPEVTR